MRLFLVSIALLLGGCDQLADAQMDDINAKVAEDAVAQYQITQSSGSAMDRCVQAGIVAAAYLQAQDQPQYERWKATESSDCAAAGLPR